MKIGSWHGWMVTLAAGIPLVLAATARGQFQVDNRAPNDANNRVGSNGYNAPAPPPAYTGNQIMTGDVTGGFQFRGQVPYTSQFAFRALLPGMGIDRFISESSAAGGSPSQNLANHVQGYYPAWESAPPPAGYAPLAPASGYVQALPPTPLEQQLDMRLGTFVGAPTAIVPKAGQAIGPGLVDPSASAIFTVSPLYGIKQWNLTEAGDRYYLSNYANLSQPGGGQMTEQQILQLRQQLNQNIVPESPANAAGGVTGQNNPGQIQPAALSPQAGNMSTDQGTRQILPPLPQLPPPGQQSAQYAKLVKEYQAYQNAHPTTDEEASRDFLAATRVRRALQESNQAGGGAPGAGGAVAAPSAESARAAIAAVEERSRHSDDSQAPANTPATVESFAAGVNAPGLADLLKSAEADIKAGKYAEAISEYDLARQVAPNNPLILVGRATADLGRSYYATAALTLRDAFGSDAALILGRYDLNNILGPARLQKIVVELKQIAGDQPDNPTPPFLLAFIFHNESSDSQAAGYLEIAAKRAGGQDQLYATLKQYWSAAPPPAPTTAPRNK